MAGDVPVWPDNMALMTVKGGCLQEKMENVKLYVTKYLFNRIIKWEVWLIKDKLKNKTYLSK